VCGEKMIGVLGDRIGDVPLPFVYKSGREKANYPAYSDESTVFWM
jgi:hypothetical protein